jgi:hypothetical protein
MDALGVAGDVSSAGAALAGLLLVFMGSIATSFDGYTKQEQRTVLSRFRLRIWFALGGFVLSILATGLALLAKANSWSCVAITAFWCLFVGFIGAVAAAVRAALDVK